MGTKENLIDNCRYNEMREFAKETFQKYGLEKREISNYFSNYEVAVPIFLRPIFKASRIGVYLESSKNENIAAASLTQMEIPAGSGYKYDLAFLVRPSADIRAPILHGDAMDPMGGVKGMFSMDLYNVNENDLDVEKFLGDNIGKIKEALEIAEPYQKKPGEGRGKYTAYLRPYKSKYRIELEQPSAKDAGALRVFYDAEVEIFKLFLEAYLASIANLKPEKKIIENNMEGFDEIIANLLSKDFAVKMGKKIYKSDFPKYFNDGFWRTGSYGDRLAATKPGQGAMPGKKKKGLIIYNSVYGSTAEAAYWVKSILGEENYIEVKRVDQVISIRPFDYVIIGSLTRQEKASKPIYDFVDKHIGDLAKKDVALFLCCGDVDETQILAVPGGPKPHLIGGRNYFKDLLDKYPTLKPVAIAGFGGRQVFPTLNVRDKLMITMVGKIAKEGAPWAGLDIWESLIPERVELFSNDLREKILGLKKLDDCTPFRRYWNSVQPATLTDRQQKKFNPKPIDELIESKRLFYIRSRTKGDLAMAMSLFDEWSKQTDINLIEQSTTSFNVYYQGIKNYGSKKDTVIHATAAELPEDPGNVHFAFRCFEKPAKRGDAQNDILLGKEIFWADGRKIDS